MVLLWALMFAAVSLAVGLPVQHTSAAVSYNQGNVIYAYDYSRNIRLPLLLPGPQQLLSKHHWSPDGRLLAYIIWDRSTLQSILHVRQANGEHVASALIDVSVDFHWMPDSREVLLLSSLGGTAGVWDVHSGAQHVFPIASLVEVRTGYVYALSQREVVVYGRPRNNATVRPYRLDLTDGATDREIDTAPCSTGPPRERQLSPDGSRLLIGCPREGKIVLTDAQTLSENTIVYPHTIFETQHNARWSPEGDRVLLAVFLNSANQHLVIDLDSGATEVLFHDRQIGDVDWLPLHRMRTG